MRTHTPVRRFDLTLGSRVLLSASGVLGVLGIALGAAGSHAGGGDLARLASAFLLIHAVAVLALGVGSASAGPGWAFCTAGAMLALGAGAFSGDLAVLAFTGSHLLKLFAPVGGFMMILGWLAVSILPWFGRTRPSSEL